MSPNELSKCKDELFKAAKNLGWQRYTVTKYHERDGDCSWQESGFLNREGKFLIEDSNLSEDLAKELIKFAKPPACSGVY